MAPCALPTPQIRLRCRCAIPTALVFFDDAVLIVIADLRGVGVVASDRVGVSQRVRHGGEAQRQAGAERRLGDDDGDDVIHACSNPFKGVAAEWPWCRPHYTIRYRNML